MNIGWNYRREHLPLEQRSHYVITNGGDQPNVVPRTASVWYYFRQTTYPKIKELWEIGDDDRQGRGDDDRHRAAADARARQRLAAALQQGRRRDDVGQHPEGRHAAVERRGSDAGQGAAEGAREQRAGAVDEARRTSCRARCATTAAAAPTTSATSRGTCRRSRCAIRRTFPACPATTGRTRSRWRRRSRTRARPPAPRCRR